MSQSGKKKENDLLIGTFKLQKLCKTVQEAIETELDRHFDVFEVVSYTQQKSGGMEYFVKIFVGGSNNCLHVKIFDPLPDSDKDKASVSKIKQCKTFLDPLTQL